MTVFGSFVPAESRACDCVINLGWKCLCKYQNGSDTIYSSKMYRWTKGALLKRCLLGFYSILLTKEKEGLVKHNVSYTPILLTKHLFGRKTNTVCNKAEKMIPSFVHCKTQQLYCGRLYFASRVRTLPTTKTMKTIFECMVSRQDGIATL